jgi:hypothetical protein
MIEITLKFDSYGDAINAIEKLNGSSNAITENATASIEINGETAPVENMPEPQNEPVINNDVERDINGIAWDSRIHASSKAKVKAGTWRYKKGLDKQYIETVESELKSALNAPVPAPAPEQSQESNQRPNIPLNASNPVPPPPGS